jgi:hypothetical protein
MYASIRQGKAKAGMADELARRIKEEVVLSSALSLASEPIMSSMRPRHRDSDQHF